jgi:hypothetical protein
MSDYQLTASEEPCPVILTEEDGTVWSIPPDPANRHYAEYLQWVEDGGVPDPYVPPEPVAPTATPEQTILYDHENRVRALEGQPPLSLGDFVDKMRA